MKRMKIHSRMSWLLCSTILMVLLAGGCRTSETANFTLAVASIVEIEPIVQLRQGFDEVFDASDFAKQHKIRTLKYNAQGDPGLINQVADKITSDKPDLIYVLGTPLAQAIVSRNPQSLVLQGGATDPVSAGLAKSWEGSGNHYFATSDLPPVAEVLSLVTQLSPQAKRIGLIYNPGETNATAVVARMRAEVSRAFPNLKLIERSISSTGDIPLVLDSLRGKIDALVLPPDNTVYAAIAQITSVATSDHIPVFATTSNAVKDGALATLTIDYKQLGRDAARLALQVLGGAKPGDLPIQYTKSPQILVSAKAAKALGIDLSAVRVKPNVSVVD
jgi:putative tryptophan/tyrosine transport system substrate-binding protein